MTKDIYHCKNCQANFIPKQKQYSTFCSQSCSAKFNNKNKKPRTKRSKEKTRQSLIKFNEKKVNMKICKWSRFLKYFVWRDFTKIIKNRCKHCNNIFYSRQNIKFCKNHSYLYTRKNKNRYKFTFNLYEYPDLFDLSLLEKTGWYSNGKIDSKKPVNMNGYTRDHKVSVNEAIKNNYDPYYIKHPLNCELMSFNDNNKKKTKSSISYDELVKKVDEYEKIWCIR